MVDVLKYLGSDDPFYILKKWMESAGSHSKIKEPSAMVLCTIGRDQMPYCRVVLAKELSEKGLVFYTNMKSQKGVQLSHHTSCSGHFYWDPLFRQVSLRGRAELVSREKTIEYWKTRPRPSQISQWVSLQSREISNREALEEKALSAEKKFKNQPIPCPKDWSGCLMVIEEIEFWMGRDHRLHDRFLFSRKSAKNWSIQRLYP